MTTTRNTTRADRVIAFVEALTITIGETAGEPFLLRDWQKELIRDIYEPTREGGKRAVRKAVFSVARKNGKTELAAALILVHLIGPESELNGEIYSAANDRNQAAIVFNAVKRMIQVSPFLSRYLSVVDSTKTIFVKRSDTKAMGSKFRALSADAGRQHGLNPSFIVYDELAQSKSRELLDTLLTSQGARSEPLFLTISTQSHDPQHPLSQMIDDALVAKDPATFCRLFAAEDDCDLLDEKQWFAANPALDDFRSLDEFKSMAEQASRMPASEANFRLLYLNQRVAMHSSLITIPDWKACSGNATFEEKEEIFLGLDLSAKTDLTALVAVSAGDHSKIRSWFWKPTDYLVEHAKRDRQPYDVWSQQGHLLTCDGRSINPMSVATKIAELAQQYAIVGLAYDRWRIDELLRSFDAIGFEASREGSSGLRIHDWGQGYKDMAPAIDALEHAVLTNTLEHSNNPVLNMCMANAVATTDAAGNRKLDKEKTRLRIDGAVALAMALGLKARLRETEEVFHDPWSDPDFNLKDLVS